MKWCFLLVSGGERAQSFSASSLRARADFSASFLNLTRNKQEGVVYIHMDGKAIAWMDEETITMMGDSSLRLKRKIGKLKVEAKQAKRRKNEWRKWEEISNV